MGTQAAPATTSITVDIDHTKLRGYSDQQLMTAWHVAQVNPVPISDRPAGELVEHIGREIIRRWLRSVEPELWRHQGRHHFWHELCQHGRWVDGVYTPNPSDPVLPAAAEVTGAGTSSDAGADVDEDGW